MGALAMQCCAFLVLGLVGLVAAIPNGLGATPQMGYNSWYDLTCSSAMNEDVIKATAAAMKSNGLAALGYEYVNLDDCWAKGRDNKTGEVFPDPATFKSGMKALADAVHADGFKFGVYTDRGIKTCAGRPGASGYETVDAKTYAAWGVDYLKEDSCNAPGDQASAFTQYGKMRDALNATGRPIFFSLCGWNPWYAPKGAELGNSWRIGPDDTNWGGILANTDIMASVAQYAGPTKGWNDPCLLLSKDHAGKLAVSELQSRAQFSLWAVMAAPLLISGSVTNMSSYTLATYSNKEVIAVSQDNSNPGTRVAGSNLVKSTTPTNVWGRKLSDGSIALVFLNAGDQNATVVCNNVCWNAMGIKGSDFPLSAYDLWSHEALPDLTELGVSAHLEAYGGHRMIKVKSKRAPMSMLIAATAGYGVQMLP